MQLSSTLAWLIDEAGGSPDADRFLAEFGARLVDDGLPLVGGALTLAVQHPIIARRTLLWRSNTGRVIEALAFAATGPTGTVIETLWFAAAGLADAGPACPPGDAGRGWLATLGGGPAHEDAIGAGPDKPVLSWIAPRPFTTIEADRLHEAARFASAPLAAITARAALTAILEAYLGRRTAARVLCCSSTSCSAPFRKVGRTRRR